MKPISRHLQNSTGAMDGQNKRGCRNDTHRNELLDLLREANIVCKYHACPQCGKTGKEVGMMQVGRPTGTNPLDGKPSAASALRMDVETCTVCQGRSALLSRIEEATKPTAP